MDSSSTSQKLADLTHNDKAFRLAVQNAFNHIIITDPDAKVIYANASVQRITGYSNTEVMGQTPKLWGGLMPKEVYEEFWHTIKDEKKVFTGEFRNKRKNGEEYIARAIVSPILDDDGTLLGFIGTEEDITKEKEVDRMKSEFISIAAHQLRTPIGSINWSADLLLGEKDKLSPDNQELLEGIAKCGVNLRDLVNSLLNVSRIESGRLSIDPQPVNLKELITQCIFELKVSLAEKKQDLQTSIENLPSINADPKALSEVIKNLLSNAIKYSPEKTKVFLEAKVDGDNVLFSIKDSGIGIPVNEQHRVFEKFYRGSNGVSKQIEGNGLGLYFVKSLVETCGGKIWFESKENEGTTFFFTLPIAGVPKKEGVVSIS